MIRHAGLLAMYEGGRWRGALIEGPSGAGKSDLALRALEGGLRLVADDRTVVWRSDGRLFGRAPDPLSALIEARGVGVLPEPALRVCEIVLRVLDAQPERIPEPEQVEIAGVRIPSLSLRMLEASATAKLRRALQHRLGAGAEGAYQAGRAVWLAQGPCGETP